MVLERQDLWFALRGRWMFPFANAHLLSWSRSVLLKIHVDLQPVVRKEGGHWRFPFWRICMSLKTETKGCPFIEMKVMSCFILVFKPMLLNLATSVNRCLLISGFFIYFWSEIWRLFVLKSLNYDYLSQMASLPINCLKAFYITTYNFQWTSFLSKKSVYQLRFLCFPCFHEV